MFSELHPDSTRKCILSTKTDVRRHIIETTEYGPKEFRLSSSPEPVKKPRKIRRPSPKKYIPRLLSSST